jgi:hypothetical protein
MAEEVLGLSTDSVTTRLAFNAKLRSIIGALQDEEETAEAALVVKHLFSFLFTLLESFQCSFWARSITEKHRSSKKNQVL